VGDGETRWYAPTDAATSVLDAPASVIQDPLRHCRNTDEFHRIRAGDVAGYGQQRLLGAQAALLIAAAAEADRAWRWHCRRAAATLAVSFAQRTVSRRFGPDLGSPILVSLLRPFGSYLMAERVEASGILAAVFAGLTMS
jgi:hypothetical protein